MSQAKVVDTMNTGSADPGNSAVDATPRQAAPTPPEPTADAISHAQTQIGLEEYARTQFIKIKDISWNMSQNPGTILDQRTIHPNSLNNFVKKLAEMMTFFSGSPTFRMVMTGSPLVSGKLIAFKVPAYVKPESLSIEEMTAWPHALIDARTMTSVEFTPTDQNDKNYHTIADPKSNGGTFCLAIFQRLNVAQGDANVNITMFSTLGSMLLLQPQLTTGSVSKIIFPDFDFETSNHPLYKLAFLDDLVITKQNVLEYGTSTAISISRPFTLDDFCSMSWVSTAGSNILTPLGSSLQKSNNVRMVAVEQLNVYSVSDSSLSSGVWVTSINHSTGQMQVNRQLSAVHSVKIGTPVGPGGLNRDLRQPKIVSGAPDLPQLDSDSAISHVQFPSGSDISGYPTFVPKGVGESPCLFNFTIDSTDVGVPQTHQFGDAIRRGDYTGMGANCLLFELVEKSTGTILDYLKLYPSGFFAARTPTTATRYTLSDVKLRFLQTIGVTETIPYNNNARMNSTTYQMNRYLRLENERKVRSTNIQKWENYSVNNSSAPDSSAAGDVVDSAPTSSAPSQTFGFHSIFKRRNTNPEIDHAGPIDFDI